MQLGIQEEANSFLSRLERAKLGAYLGTYCVRLDNIACPAVAFERRTNVKRLRRVFQIQGCLRFVETNFIIASIAKPREQLTISQLENGKQELLLPLNEQVLCIHGKCRILAAKEVLQGPDRWWVVSLYNQKETVSPIAQFFENNCVNEDAFSDGIIYRGLRQCQEARDIHGERRWWSLLSYHKRKCLKQFTSSHHALKQSLDHCLIWPALWKDMRIGVLHKIVAQKCDEEMNSYLQSLISFYTSFTSSGSFKLSSELIICLQGRSPRYSLAHRKLLQRYTTAHTIAPATENDIWSTIDCQELAIPSFLTFFEDYKYTYLCARVLKILVSAEPLPAKTQLRQVYREHFAHKGSFYTQIDEEHFKRGQTTDEEDAFKWSYAQLWLCAMRYWPYCLQDRPRQTPAETSNLGLTHSQSAWACVARTARKLGFNSSHINELEGKSDIKLQLEGSTYSDFTAPSQAAGLDDGDITNLCGVPVYADVEKDYNSLFIERLLVTTITPNDNLTSLYTRRTLFIRLFPFMRNLAQSFTFHNQSEDVVDEGRDVASSRFQDSTEQFTEALVAARSSPTDPIPSSAFTYELQLLDRSTKTSTKVFPDSTTREEWCLKEIPDHKFTTPLLLAIDKRSLRRYEGPILAFPKDLDTNMIRAVYGFAAHALRGN